MPILAPSLLSADFMNLSRDINTLINAGAKLLHLDVMDGHFVPNLTIGPDIIKGVKGCVGEKAQLDTHLMLSNPLKYIPKFCECGSDYITVHIECEDNITNCINEVKKYSIRAGLSIKPGTPASALAEFINDIDLVLIMTVEPGFGGQALIGECLSKIDEVRAMSDTVLISIDGGVNKDNCDMVAKFNPDIMIAGNALFENREIESNFKETDSKINKK